MTKQRSPQRPAAPPPAREEANGEQISLRKQLAIIFVARTAVNTPHRIIYPFLPSIARGLGVSLATASGLVTVRLVAGLAAPFLGPLVDRFPRRRTMEAALLLLAAASLLLVALGSFAAAVAALALYGVAKVLYDPAVHAYLGDTIPYRRRGRAVGVVELSWSAAWLLGVPAAGLLIEWLGWRAPWAVLIGFGLLGMWLTRAVLPPGHRGRRRDGSRPDPNSSQGRDSSPARQGIGALAGRWRSLLRQRAVVILLLTSLLLSAAMEIPFIVYGAWLEAAYGLSLSALGLVSVVVGLAEATAEFGTTILTDRLGKKRSVLVGLMGLAAGLVALPSLAALGLVPALAGLVVVVLSFEFGIVSLLPLATELAPDSRASLLSLNIAALSLGRIIGAFSGGRLWEWLDGGIAPNALAGAVCALGAALLMAWGMVEIGE